MNGTPLADIGMSPGVVAALIGLWLGSFSVMAVITAAIGVRLVGRWGRDSLIVPAIVTLVTTLALSAIGRFGDLAAPILIGAALGVAIASAAIQRMLIDRYGDDAHAVRVAWLLGGLTVGSVLGGATGLLAGVAAGPSQAILGGAIFGVVFGGLVGVMAARRHLPQHARPPESAPARPSQW